MSEPKSKPATPNGTDTEGAASPKKKTSSSNAASGAASVEVCPHGVGCGGFWNFSCRKKHFKIDEKTKEPISAEGDRTKARKKRPESLAPTANSVTEDEELEDNGEDYQYDYDYEEEGEEE